MVLTSLPKMTREPIAQDDTVPNLLPMTMTSYLTILAFVPYDTVVRDAFATNLCPFWPYVPYDTVGLSCHMIAMVHDTLGTIFCLTSTSHVL